jgi:hypothetical protein
MKSGCGLVITLALGFLGLGILFIAVNQYIIKGESWYDNAIPVKAVVSDTLIVYELVAGNTTAPFSVPVIQYALDNKLITDTLSQWSYRLDTENITYQSNTLWLPGDSLNLLLHPDDPDIFALAGSSDDTNMVGFVIWGAIGLAFFIPFLFRVRKLFPKDAEQRHWGD